MPQRMVKSSKGRQRRRQQRNETAGDSVGKYASDAWSLAKRTAYGLNEIRKLINIETKVAEATGTSAISTTGAVTSISLIVQGLDYNNRVGDSIKLQRVEFRTRWTVGTGTGTFCRTLLVRDLDNYGTKPAISDVLQAVSVLSPKNYLNSDRFSILYDELGTLNQSDTNSVSVFESPHEGHIKYLGTTAADASSGKGAMYLMFLSNEAAGVTSPTVVLHSRLYYTDD